MKVLSKEVGTTRKSSDDSCSCVLLGKRMRDLVVSLLDLIPSETSSFLTHYSKPDNVHEIEHLTERAIASTPHPNITPEDLPETNQTAPVQDLSQACGWAPFKIWKRTISCACWRPIIWTMARSPRSLASTARHSSVHAISRAKTDSDQWTTYSL
jgi:DNA-binding NtrC family response regulator